MARACEASLTRLGTDYLDLYLLHFPSFERSISRGRCRIRTAARGGQNSVLGRVQLFSPPNGRPIPNSTRRSLRDRCPCRDVGEAILVGSLRPIRTARETLGGRTLERPSCGGFMPTAETILFPAYSARSRRSLTSSVRLDNEPNLKRWKHSRVADTRRMIKQNLF
jgi:hypothetical protein